MAVAVSSTDLAEQAAALDRERAEIRQQLAVAVADGATDQVATFSARLRDAEGQAEALRLGAGVAQEREAAAEALRRQRDALALRLEFLELQLGDLAEVLKLARLRESLDRRRVARQGSPAYQRLVALAARLHPPGAGYLLSGHGLDARDNPDAITATADRVRAHAEALRRELAELD